MKSDQKYQSIGKRIREAREKAGLSQKELAEVLGYESATAISLIESGDRKVDLIVLEKISATLKRDIKFFLGQKEEAPTVTVALRADKNISKEDEEKILSFIDYIKSQK